MHFDVFDYAKKLDDNFVTLYFSRILEAQSWVVTESCFTFSLTGKS